MIRKDHLERQSNIELFRIVAMLMILIVHVNGWFLQKWGLVTTWSADKDVFVGCARALIQSVTCIGVDCFILISGYFGIHPKVKSLFKIFSTVVFCYIICYFAEIILGDTVFSWRGCLSCFRGFSRGNWFVQCYLFLMLFAPVLNKFIDGCSEKQALTYIGIYLMCSVYFSQIWHSSYFYFNGGFSVTTFIMIYLAGRYIGKFGYSRINKLSSRTLWLSYIFTVFVIFAIRVIFIDEERWLSYDSPLILFSAATLMACFLKMNIHSRLINWIAVSTFSVFILHTCNPVVDWFANLDVLLFNKYSFVEYSIYISAIILLVFCGSILLDKVRMLLIRPVERYLDWFCGVLCKNVLSLKLNHIKKVN